jgi:hypothetical protein
MMTIVVVALGMLFTLAIAVSDRALEPMGRCSMPTLPLFEAPPKMEPQP